VNVADAVAPLFSVVTMVVGGGSRAIDIIYGRCRLYAYRIRADPATVTAISVVPPGRSAAYSVIEEA
jgi:hypothetical protein